MLWVIYFVHILECDFLILDSGQPWDLGSLSSYALPMSFVQIWSLFSLFNDRVHLVCNLLDQISNCSTKQSLYRVESFHFLAFSENLNFNTKILLFPFKRIFVLKFRFSEKAKRFWGNLLLSFDIAYIVVDNFIFCDLTQLFRCFNLPKVPKLYILIIGSCFN